MSKIVDRVRKLLELSHSNNEHEAAQASALAAQLMSENAITEAMLEVVSTNDSQQSETRAREGIVEVGLPDATERRVAWRDRVASSVAYSLDCKTIYWNRKLQAIGRESATQTWVYMCQYLFAEITRLADEAWTADGKELAAFGHRPSVWRGAFMLGAADVVARKLYDQVQERTANEKAKALDLANAPLLHIADGEVEHVTQQMALARVDLALAIVAKDRAEVERAFKTRTAGPGWRKTRTLGESTRRKSGYAAGREAGNSIDLATKDRRRLG